MRPFAWAYRSAPIAFRRRTTTAERFPETSQMPCPSRRWPRRMDAARLSPLTVTTTSRPCSASASASELEDPSGGGRKGDRRDMSIPSAGPAAASAPVAATAASAPREADIRGSYALPGNRLSLHGGDGFVLAERGAGGGG